MILLYLDFTESMARYFSANQPLVNRIGKGERTYFDTEKIVAEHNVWLKQHPEFIQTINKQPEKMDFKC